VPRDDELEDDELDELQELEDDELELELRVMEKHLRAASACAARIRTLLEEL